jgi:hypothetical protein
MDSSRPLYHCVSGTRSGYIYFMNGSHWLLYKGASNSLEIDHWSLAAIRDDRMRLYGLHNQDPWYSSYTHATVHDDGTLIFYRPWNLNYGSIYHLNFTVTSPLSMISRYTLVHDPVIADMNYRDRRTSAIEEGSNPPPSPPGGGAALAQGAESVQVAPASTPLGMALAAVVIPNTHRNVTPLDVWATPLAYVEDTLTEETVPSDSPRSFFDENREEHIRNLLNDPPITFPLLSELAMSLLRSEYSDVPVLVKGCAKKIPGPVKRVADIVIADALNQELSCAISLTPLTKENAVCVAPCYHVFEKDGIQKWLSTSSTCPECRTPCAL